MGEPLTDQQIENWRKILSFQFGPYALFMPREMVQNFRDRMQEHFSSIAEAEPQKSACDCDPEHNGKTIMKDGRVTCNKCHLPRNEAANEQK